MVSAQETQQAGDRTTTVYLCRCEGEISSHIDLEEVSKCTSLLPEVRSVVSHDALCSEGGRAFMREVISAHPSDRVVICACSAEVPEAPLTDEFEAAGANKYLVDQVDIREQCAWVHPDTNSATAKATALIRGGVRRGLKQEAMEDLVFQVEGAALVVGAGEAGTIAAKTIASSGFKAYVVDKSNEVPGKESLVDARPSNSNCRACGTHDPKECPVPLGPEDLGCGGNVQLLLGSEIEAIEGGVGKWQVSIRTSEGKKQFDVGTIIITMAPVTRPSAGPSESERHRQATETQSASISSQAGYDDKEPSEEANRVLDLIHVGRGEGRTARHLVGRHLSELNRGIFVLESSLGQANAICAVEDAGLAADAAVDIMRKKTVRMPRIIARVEEFRCRGCGKCKDVCKYDAVTLEEREGGIKVAKIDEARCEGCGLCRVACCNGAMALLCYTTTQLLANMMGIIEEVEQ